MSYFGIIQYVAFESGFSYSVLLCVLVVVSFLLLGSCSLHKCTTVFFISSPVEEHLGYFQFRTIIKQATVNIHIHTGFHFSWVNTELTKIPSSYGKCMIDLWPFSKAVYVSYVSSA